MAKKVVSKRTFQTCNFLFYSLCLAGLIWQLVQISINFFQFDVVKDINVKMPEEIGDKGLGLNVCLDSVYVLDNDSFIEYLKENAESRYHVSEPNDIHMRNRYISKMTLGNRFRTMKNNHAVLNALYIERFIYTTQFDDMVCYQVGDSVSRLVNQNIDLNIDYLSIVRISRGYRLPEFDEGRLLHITDISRNSSKYVTVNFYQFRFEKLQPPYSDRCIFDEDRDIIKLEKDGYGNDMLSPRQVIRDNSLLQQSRPVEHR